MSLRRCSRALLWLSLLLGCDRGSAATSTPPDASTAAPTAAHNEDAQPGPVPEPATSPDASKREAATDIEGAQPSLNAPYTEQTNPKQWTRRFEREGREVFDHRDEVIAALDLQAGQAVADVGAGTGLFTLPIAQAVGPTGTVFAVDVQNYFLEHIRKRANAASLDNIRTILATQRSVQLPADSVDVVVLIDAYHHIEHPAPYLQSIARALRPGGKLVVIDYRRIEGQSEAWLLDHIRADPETFRAEIEDAGFSLSSRRDLLEENFFFEFQRSKAP